MLLKGLFKFFLINHLRQLKYFIIQFPAIIPFSILVILLTILGYHRLDGYITPFLVENLTNEISFDITIRLCTVIAFLSFILAYFLLELTPNFSEKYPALVATPHSLQKLWFLTNTHTWVITIFVFYFCFAPLLFILTGKHLSSLLLNQIFFVLIVPSLLILKSFFISFIVYALIRIILFYNYKYLNLLKPIFRLIVIFMFSGYLLSPVIAKEVILTPSLVAILPNYLFVKALLWPDNVVNILAYSFLALETGIIGCLALSLGRVVAVHEQISETRVVSSSKWVFSSFWLNFVLTDIKRTLRYKGLSLPYFLLAFLILAIKFIFKIREDINGTFATLQYFLFISLPYISATISLVSISRDKQLEWIYLSSPFSFLHYYYLKQISAALLAFTYTIIMTIFLVPLWEIWFAEFTNTFFLVIGLSSLSFLIGGITKIDIDDTLGHLGLALLFMCFAGFMYYILSYVPYLGGQNLILGLLFLLTPWILAQQQLHSSNKA